MRDEVRFRAKLLYDIALSIDSDHLADFVGLWSGG